jgi:hypothetical protein
MGMKDCFVQAAHIEKKAEKNKALSFSFLLLYRIAQARALNPSAGASACTEKAEQFSELELNVNKQNKAKAPSENKDFLALNKHTHNIGMKYKQALINEAKIIAGVGELIGITGKYTKAAKGPYDSESNGPSPTEG